MSKDRETIEAYLGMRLPDGTVEDAAALAASAAAGARAAAAKLPAPRDPDGFLQVLESLAGDDSQGGAGD